MNATQYTRTMYITFLGGERNNTKIVLVDNLLGKVLADRFETYESMSSARSKNAANQRDYGYRVFVTDLGVNEQGHEVITLNLLKDD